MQNTNIVWKNEKEEDMFSKWIVKEIEEWKGYGYHGCKRIPFGVEDNGKKAIWQSDMYEYLSNKKENARYLFTYCFFYLEEKTYCVDVGMTDFGFRIFFRIYKNKIETEIRLKKRGEARYYAVDHYLSIEGHIKELLKKQIPDLVSFYEEMKVFISTKSSERLTILTKGIEFYEKDLERYKNT